MEFVLGLLYRRKLSSTKPPLLLFNRFLTPVYRFNRVFKCCHCNHIALGLKALWMPTSQTFPKSSSLLFVLLQQAPKVLTLLKNHTTHFLCAFFWVPWTSSHRTVALPSFYWHIFHVLLHFRVSTLWKQSFKDDCAEAEWNTGSAWRTAEEQDGKKRFQITKLQECDTDVKTSNLFSLKHERCLETEPSPG